MPTGIITQDAYYNRSGSNKESPFRLGSTSVSLGLFNTAKGLYVGSNPVYHPEAINWVIRVHGLAAPGEVTYEQLDAVSKFCYAIDAAGIRDRFMRLNLFCGNNLKACVVPLYTNTSMNYTHVGYAVDTNNNFVDGDYSGSTGLTGDESSQKTLETGVTLYESNSGEPKVEYNSHMSLYYRSGSLGNGYMMGVIDDAENGASSHHFLEMNSTATYLHNSAYIQSVNHTIIDGTSTTLTGLTVATTNGTTGIMYNDNTDITNNSYSFYNNDPNDLNNICIFGTTGPMSGPYAGTSATLGSYSFGNYMTPTQVANYTSAMSAFQTAMGRAAP